MIQLQETKDYDMFDPYKFNRKITNAHEGGLEESMTAMGFVGGKPILVSEDMEIIDGHHRFYIAKKLGLKLSYFVMEIEDTAEVIRHLDLGTVTWNPLDWLYYWHYRGKRAYTRIIEKVEDGFPPATVVMVATLKRTRRRKKWIATGKLKITNKDFDEFLYKIKIIAKNIPFVKNTHHLKPILLAKYFYDGEFDLDVLIHKSKMYPTKWRKSADQKDGLRELESFYNYRNRKNRINLSEFYV